MCNGLCNVAIYSNFTWWRYLCVFILQVIASMIDPCKRCQCMSTCVLCPSCLQPPPRNPKPPGSWLLYYLSQFDSPFITVRSHRDSLLFSAVFSWWQELVPDAAGDGGGEDVGDGRGHGDDVVLVIMILMMIMMMLLWGVTVLLSMSPR